MKQFVFIFILIWGCCTLYSQNRSIPLKHDNDCSFIIKEADQFYQDGLYEKCIDVMEGVIKTCKLTHKEEEHALELLAKAYIETKDMGKAESAVNIMLKRYPHYELKEEENYEVFNRMVKKYKIHPALSIGIRNTALWTRFNTTSTFTVPGGSDNTEPYAKKGYAFMYYGWGEIEFDKGISINGDLIWRSVGYDRFINIVPDIYLNYWEWQQLVEIPVYVKKYFNPGKNLLSYATAGIGWLYMTKALGNINSYNQAEDHRTIINNVNVLSMRTRNNYEWLAGAGIGYKLKNLRLFLDLRYYGGLNSFTNASHRLDNQTLADYFYVDNSVKMNKFEIGASISYTLINSVKRVKH